MIAGIIGSLTAAFGSSLEPHVLTLKAYRDRYLLKTEWGKKFVEFYYRSSLPLAEYISDHRTLKIMSELPYIRLSGYAV